jgi:nucleoside 2-deoxyribosyltransferase
MKIYLAGPINGCTDEQANGWRSRVKALHADCLDPMSRDYRGKESDSVAEIVEGDKSDIDQCDAVLVYFERPSVGTSMEVLYAWERKKPVIVIDHSDKPISPWLKYHSNYICLSVFEAISLIKFRESLRNVFPR